MTLSEFILKAFLSGKASSYRTLRDLSYGKISIGGPERRPTPASLSATLSRLKKQGFIESEGASYSITKKGKRHLSFLSSFLRSRQYSKNNLKKSLQEVIITFDIPESNKGKRNWLRGELVGLGFKPLQKSVWIGKVVLPKTFIQDIYDLDLAKHVHIFSVNKLGTLTNRLS